MVAGAIFTAPRKIAILLAPGMALRRADVKKTQRALRSKNFNPDRKFESWLENVQSQSIFAVFLCTGPSWCYREGLDRKISIHDRSLEIFNPAEGRDQFFLIFGPSWKGVTEGGGGIPICLPVHSLTTHTLLIKGVKVCPSN